MNWRTYKQHKRKLAEVNAFWTRSNTLFGKVTRFATQSDVSHIGFLIKEHGRVMCYEVIEGRGCIQLPASNRFGIKEEILTLPVNVNKDKLLKSIYKDIGKIEYNMLGALVSLFYRTKNAKRFCSEWFIYKLGLKLEHLNRGITPADVLTALSEPK
jgi:hypothetical protein